MVVYATSLEQALSRFKQISTYNPIAVMRCDLKKDVKLLMKLPTALPDDSRKEDLS